MIEEVGFAEDSPLEGEGFEPSVPRKRDPLFKSAHQLQRAVHNELCDRRNDQVLDAAKFKPRSLIGQRGRSRITPGIDTASPKGR
jgi:hypothetical protein